MPCPCHAPALLCCCLEKSLSKRRGHGMASVNQTRSHFVSQMGKTNSKPLAARHGRGMAWARHAMCESALRRVSLVDLLLELRSSNPCGGLDVCRECCVLSGRGPCVGLNTRPEESYRLWCVPLSVISKTKK